MTRLHLGVLGHVRRGRPTYRDILLWKVLTEGLPVFWAAGWLLMASL